MIVAEKWRVYKSATYLLAIWRGPYSGNWEKDTNSQRFLSRNTKSIEIHIRKWYKSLLELQNRYDHPNNTMEFV